MNSDFCKFILENNESLSFLNEIVITSQISTKLYDTIQNTITSWSASEYTSRTQSHGDSFPICVERLTGNQFACSRSLNHKTTAGTFPWTALNVNHMQSKLAHFIRIGQLQAYKFIGGYYSMLYYTV